MNSIFVSLLKSFFLVILLLIGNIHLSANDFGFFGTPLSAIYTNTNGTPTNYTADVFDATVLGTLSVFTITGGQVQTYKNGAGNVCSATLYYQVYPDGGLKGSFNAVSINYKTDLGSGDQEWESTGLTIDVLNGLTTTGSYVLEIYYDITGSSSGGCGSTKYQNNNGNPDNYTLKFDYTAPSSYTLTYDGNTSDGGSTASTTGNLPLTVASNSFTKTGYTFSFWNTSSDGTGTSYAEGASYNVASNAILYAQWIQNAQNVYYVL